MAVKKEYLLRAIETRIGDASLELILDKHSLSQMTRLKLAHPNEAAQIEKMEKELTQRVNMDEGTIKYLTELKEQVEKGTKELEGISIE